MAYRFGGLKYDFDRSATHPKFDLTGIRTYGLQIMDSTFHVSEMLVLITEPSDTKFHISYVQT